MPKAKRGGYYAVAKGHQAGIYSTWLDCEAQVKGYKHAVFKKFNTQKEAESFIRQGSYDLSQSNHNSSTVSAAKCQSTSLSTGSKRGKRNLTNVEIAKITKTKEGYPRQVYCDGACPNNGKATAYSGIGVYWVPPTKAVDLYERTPVKRHTNQIAELYAILRVLESDPQPDKPLEILTDSDYSINCLTQWWKGWSMRGWRKSDGTEPENMWLIRCNLEMLRRRSGKVKFTHVFGHMGITGNEMADQLANRGAVLGDVPIENWQERYDRILARTNAQDSDTQPDASPTLEIEFDMADEFLLSEADAQAEVDAL